MPFSNASLHTPQTAGQRCPSVVLSELVGGALREVRSDLLFGGCKALVIGVPGAFTPVCHGSHLPDFVANADRFRAAGFTVIACVTPNDPWVNAAWSREIDPEGKIRMLSDGNLDFARQMGLTAVNRELFLGERSKRYLLQLRNAVVERMSVERLMVDYSCTRTDDVTLEI
jgi:peroxiredoxin